MRRKFSFFVILFLFFPFFISADGGIVHWPPNVYLEEKAQKVILAWNGEKEILILSNDFKTEKPTLALRIIPFPSKPEIKEGKIESFEKLVEIMNKKIEEMKTQWMERDKRLKALPEKGIEVIFQEEIGVHDITVIKVSNFEDFLGWIENFIKNKNLGEKEISQEFKDSIENYLRKEVNYFVFDVINLHEGEKSLTPLIYKFETNYLYYPLEITGVSEIKGSYGGIQIFLITPDIKMGEEIYSPYPSVKFSLEELSEVESNLPELFNSQVNVRNFYWYGNFSDFREDLILFPQIWKRDLKIGDEGEDVKALQKVLINYGFWQSKEKPREFFDENTKKALISFQERFKEEILEPLNLERGTGYFGSKSREFFEKKFTISLKKEIVFPRNLYLGTQGDDVILLQHLLIKEGVWPREDIQPTGYFGQITYFSVIAFQEKYKEEILNPLGLEKGTGFVGALTRKVLEKIYKGEY